MIVLREKSWDTNFFRRPIFSLVVGEDLSDRIKELQIDLLEVRKIEGALVEAQVSSRFFGNIAVLEELGFRLVDSRLEFETETSKTEFSPSLHVGTLRSIRDQDVESVDAITISELVENPRFTSRFKNSKYFSMSETRDYYVQWNRWALDTDAPLFCIWEVDHRVVGFYSIIRQARNGSIPRYKVALAAVLPDYQSLGAQNEMQYWLFSNAPDDRWLTINSPALTNLPGLKNNIRAGKSLRSVEYYLFFGGESAKS